MALDSRAGGGAESGGDRRRSKSVIFLVFFSLKDKVENLHFAEATLEKIVRV